VTSVLQKAADAALREHLLLRGVAGYSAEMAGLPDKLGAIEAASRVFERQGVPYALIGGLAVGVRSGVPRATLDVDFAIASTVDRDALAQAMLEAGFRLLGSFAHSTNFQHPSGEPVQLAYDAEFDPMIARAEPIVLERLTLPVVTKQDLIRMKQRAAADPARRRSKALRDQADIALLEGDLPDPNEGW
jgi:hypothetical protein